MEINNQEFMERVRREKARLQAQGLEPALIVLHPGRYYQLARDVDVPHLEVLPQTVWLLGVQVLLRPEIAETDFMLLTMDDITLHSMNEPLSDAHGPSPLSQAMEEAEEDE